MSENHDLSTVQEVVDQDTYATWSVRYVDPSGFACQLFLEARSGSDVLKKAQKAIEKLLETHCLPIPIEGIKSNVGQKSQEEASFCPLHQTTMKLWQKGNKSWYAHKTPDGKWCRSA